jgi:hypothetical protein
MPLSRRRKHRARISHRAQVSAGLTALATLATVTTVVLIVAGSVLLPSSAMTGKLSRHPTRIVKVRTTVTATATVTATVTPLAPTQTVTATQNVAGPTQTVTTTITVSPTGTPAEAATTSSTATPTSSPTVSASSAPGTGKPGIGVYMSGNNSGLDSYTSGWAVQPNVASFYLNWNSSVPSLMKSYAGQGREIQVSLMTKISAGNWVTWNSIANGSQDAHIIAMIKALDALGTRVLLSLDCEPDAQYDVGGTTPGVAQGQTPAQYVAAANHVADLVHANSTHVESSVHLAGFRTPALEASFLPAHAKLDNIEWDPYKTGSHPVSETATQLFATYINNVLVPYGYGDTPRHINETGIMTDTFSNGGSFTTQTQIDFYNSIPAAMATDHIESVIWFRANSGAHDYIPTDPTVDQAFAAMTAKTLG